MAITNPAELDLLRRNTKAFIDVNSITLALVPRIKIRQGTGSVWQDQAPRLPQRLRLIDQSTSNAPVPGTLAGADGIQRKVQFQLLGQHDAVFGLYDYWQADGMRYEIAEVFPPNGYEQRAQVICYGY